MSQEEVPHRPGALRLAEEAPRLLQHCACSLSTLRAALACRAACRGWWRCSSKDKWLKRCALNGSVLAEERRGLWRYLAGLKNLEARWCARLGQEEASDVDRAQGFELLAARPLPKGKVPEIERDVSRTFPTHPLFKGEAGLPGREQLLRVLRAVAAAWPDVGYCQGMNFVAATLLIHVGSAQEAFWMLLALIEHYHFQHVFAPGVPLLPLRIFQFSGVVRERLPRLWRHLKEESFSLDIFAHQCVLTLFAYSIEPDFLAHVYDVFFATGWKAVFRIGLGLLAIMEGKLLAMGVEEISRYMHQCKRHFDPAELNPNATAHAALAELLKFKVSRATLEALQHAFQLQRWEALLAHAEGEREEPLPIGLKRSPSESCFLVEAHAFCTGNAPLSCRDTNATPSGTLRIPLEALLRLKAALAALDNETQEEVSALRARVAAVEKDLAALTKDAAPLKSEVEEAELDRQEWLEVKKALMETLQVAVRTSPSVRQSSGARPPQDDVVMQCMAKLKRVESDIFERQQRMQAKVKELEPLEKEAEELRGKKAGAMAELSGCLERRELQRRRCLGAGLREVLPPDCVAPDPEDR